MVYKNYDQVQLDLQYNNRFHVPDFEQYLERWETLSRKVEKKLPNIKDVEYGSLPLETLDIFPAAHSNAKTQIFIHGGYWRTFDKSSFYFIADAFAQYGTTTVLINYPLAPSASMDQIVSSCRKALLFLHKNLRQFNGDPSQLYVTGHSAGGHLATMLITEGDQAFDGSILQGICAISGLYNLIPIQSSNINDSLTMSREAALQNSPVQLSPAEKCSVILAVGAEETEEFIAQSEELFSRWRNRVHTIQLFTLGGLNHFSMLDSMAAPDSSLHQQICTLMKL